MKAGNESRTKRVKLPAWAVSAKSPLYAACDALRSRRAKAPGVDAAADAVVAAILRYAVAVDRVTRPNVAP